MTNDNGDKTLEPSSRERLNRWISETQQVGSVLSAVLAEEENLRARLDACSRDGERMRQDVLALRSENQQLRAEREAATDGLSRLMEQIQVLGSELERRFKVTPGRRSPFEREVEPRAQTY